MGDGLGSSQRLGSRLGSGALVVLLELQKHRIRDLATVHDPAVVPLDDHLGIGVTRCRNERQAHGPAHVGTHDEKRAVCIQAAARMKVIGYANTSNTPRWHPQESIRMRRRRQGALHAAAVENAAVVKLDGTGPILVCRHLHGAHRAAVVVGHLGVALRVEAALGGDGLCRGAGLVAAQSCCHHDRERAENVTSRTEAAPALRRHGREHGR